MLKYVAAMATAVSLFIASMPVAAEPAQQAEKKPVGQVAPTPGLALGSVRIPFELAISASAAGDAKLYQLTVGEQRALNRALFRSVRFLDSIG